MVYPEVRLLLPPKHRIVDLDEYSGEEHEKAKRLADTLYETRDPETPVDIVLRREFRIRANKLVKYYYWLKLQAEKPELGVQAEINSLWQASGSIPDSGSP